MKKSRFYAVAGVNAYGVYDNYDEVLKSKKYIASFKCKRFTDFEVAKNEADRMYVEMQGDNYFDYTISEIKRINWCYYRRKAKESENTWNV